MARAVLDRYRSGDVDEVHVVYTEFRSPIRRHPRVVRILPVELPAKAGDAASASVIERWHYERPITKPSAPCADW